MQLHPSHQPHLSKTFSENSIILVSAFYQCSQLLCQYSEYSLLNTRLCYDPFCIQFPFSRKWMISDVLHCEFGDIVYHFLTRDPGVSYHTHTAQDIQHGQHTELLQQQIEFNKYIIHHWP